MGVLADAVLAHGGHVIGVIPQSLVDLEVAHTGLPDLRVVASMHERKALMADLADAFIALPGGLGTLDELCEALTLIQTGKIQNYPVVLIGTEYWSPFLALLRSNQYAVSYYDQPLGSLIRHRGMSTRGWADAQAVLSK